MADKKLPAIQWYPGDWRKDPGVQALDYASRGIWFEVLMLMHESEQRGRLMLNGRAMPDAAIARILGIPEADWKQTRSTLLSYGVASEDENGAFICRRMVKDEALRQNKIQAGRKGGRRSRPKAERKQDPKQNGSRPEAEGEANGGSSVSTSPSVSDAEHPSTASQPYRNDQPSSSDASASGAGAPQSFQQRGGKVTGSTLMGRLRDGDPELGIAGLWGTARKPGAGHTEKQERNTIETLHGKGIAYERIEKWILGAALMRDGRAIDFAEPGESLSMGVFFLNRTGVRPFAQTAEDYFDQWLEAQSKSNGRGGATRLRVVVGS